MAGDRLTNTFVLNEIDIDWEYPTSDAEADQMVELLKTIHHGLRELKEKKDETNPYLLTIAAVSLDIDHSVPSDHLMYMSDP